MKSSFSKYKEQMKNHIYTCTEFQEMRDAFGDTATVVDVLTGEKIYF